MMALQMLMKALKDEDAAVHQNALAALCVAAGCEIQHRLYIANNAHSTMDAVTGLLSSTSSFIVHNAALLVGQCCSCSADYRKLFVATPRALGALVDLLNLAEGGEGTIGNACWALRYLLIDADCGIDEDSLARVRRALPRLAAHSDFSIRIHGNILGMALPQPKKEATLQLRREKSLQAVCALERLAAGDEAGDSPTTEQLSFKEEFSPVNKAKSLRTRKGKPSLLSPWKKNCSVLSMKTNKALVRPVPVRLRVNQ